MRNPNVLEDAGKVNFGNWETPWNTIKTKVTSSGNPRIDMVAFGEYHPLMPLIDSTDIRLQVRLHKRSFVENFSAEYSKGMFPPENVFAAHMIPAPVKEGIEWVLVDNVHFERSCMNYPYSTSGNLYEANRADVLNQDPGDWKALNNLWAPTQISAAAGFTGDLKIYDLAGRCVLQRELAGSQQAVDIHSLPQGMYIMILTPKDGQAVLKMKYVKL